MFLDLPHDVIRSVARIRLCAHSLRIDLSDLDSRLESQNLPYM